MKYTVFIFLICTTIIVTKEVDGEMDSTYVLPDNVKPIRYNLTLEPTFDIINDIYAYFNGSVAIDIAVSENTACIKLNSKSIHIDTDSVQVMDSNQSLIKVVDSLFDEVREFFIINLEVELIQHARYKLIISNFSGNLRQDNVGFYLGKYLRKSQDGLYQQKYFAVSDFEPSDARKAFPCFDAPNMKATFIINIIRSGSYISLSNEQLEHTENLGNDRFRDTFKETAIMPTYVVAFIVVDFEHTAQVERHRVFAKAEAIDSGKLDYALAEGVTLLKLMEEFTGVKYALSKMDQVAIPEKYFQEEAMENWGLVTFSEDHLFISNETSKTEDFERCTTYIAHEFSHQWFGNLVTFQEWQYIWLSEGFAAFFQYYLASLAKPSWRLMDQYVVTILHSILVRDTTDTEPMNYPPKSIGKIPNVWICYLKASAVIRMHQHILTPPIFQKGLHIYLERNKFKAVTPSDLYRAYQDAIDENTANELVGNYNVSTILSSWDSNAGFPIITVTRNYETGTVTISQTRYFENMEVDDTDTTWYVPINYVYQSDKNYNFSDTSASLWLINKNITLQNHNVDGWLLVNKQQTGYYRVNYDLKNWDRLALYLNTEDYEKIHPINRAQLINEAFRFAESGIITYNVPFNISKYLARERDYIPVYAFVNNLYSLQALLKSSKVYDVFQTFVLNSLETGYNNIGFEEREQDTHIDKLHRIKILPWLCKFGHSDLASKSLELIKTWRKTGRPTLPPNLENELLCCAMKYAPLEDWEFVYNIAQKFDSKKKQMYYYALQCSDNQDVLRRIFDVYLAPNLNNNSFIYTRGTYLSFFRFIDNQLGGLKIAMDYISNSNITVSNRYLYSIADQLRSTDQLNQLNLQGRVSSDLLKKLEDMVKKNMEYGKQQKYIEIENWFTEYNKI